MKKLAITDKEKTEEVSADGNQGKEKGMSFSKLMKKNPSKDFAVRARGKKIYAFDFGEYAVKIAVGKITKDKAEIKHLILLENDDRKTKITSANQDEFRKKINKAFSQLNLISSGGLGLVTIGSRNYISRRLDIPYANEQDRNGLVAYEMSTDLSLDMEMYLYQHKVLRIYDNNGVKMCTVRAVAVSKELCELYYGLMDKLKLKPAVMDIDANGVERLLVADSHLKSITADSTVAVVDLGKQGTEVSIFEKGLCVSDTHLEQGDGWIVSAAKNALGVQIADIHNGNKLIVPPKTVYEILLQPDTSENAKQFRTAVEEWLSAVNNAIRHYDLNHQDTPVSRLLIYGGSPQMSWLRAYLERYLNIPAEEIQSVDCFRMVGKAIRTDHSVGQYLNALNLLLIK